MAERLRRAAAWLGLVTDDRYADYDERDETNSPRESIGRSCSTRQVGRPSVTPLETRRPGGGGAATATLAPPAARPRMADVSRIITVHPRTYNEARTIGEHFRDGVPVIMNLSEMEDVDAKRLVDFAAGLIFGLRGTSSGSPARSSCSPHRTSPWPRRTRSGSPGGFFNQS